MQTCRPAAACAGRPRPPPRRRAPRTPAAAPGAQAAVSRSAAANIRGAARAATYEDGRRACAPQAPRAGWRMHYGLPDCKSAPIVREAGGKLQTQADVLHPASATDTKGMCEHTRAAARACPPTTRQPISTAAAARPAAHLVPAAQHVPHVCAHARRRAPAGRRRAGAPRHSSARPLPTRRCTLWRHSARVLPPGAVCARLHAASCSLRRIQRSRERAHVRQAPQRPPRVQRGVKGAQVERGGGALAQRPRRQHCGAPAQLMGAHRRGRRARRVRCQQAGRHQGCAMAQVTASAAASRRRSLCAGRSMRRSEPATTHQNRRQPPLLPRPLRTGKERLCHSRHATQHTCARVAAARGWVRAPQARCAARDTTASAPVVCIALGRNVAVPAPFQCAPPSTRWRAPVAGRTSLKGHPCAQQCSAYVQIQGWSELSLLYKSSQAQPDYRAFGLAGRVKRRRRARVLRVNAMQRRPCLVQALFALQQSRAMPCRSLRAACASATLPGCERRRGRARAAGEAGHARRAEPVQPTKVHDFKACPCCLAGARTPRAWQPILTCSEGKYMRVKHAVYAATAQSWSCWLYPGMSQIFLLVCLSVPECVCAMQETVVYLYMHEHQYHIS